MAEKFSNEWLEEMHYDYELIDEMVGFFNQFYGFNEHPLTRETAMMMSDYTRGTQSLGIITDALMWKALNPKTQQEINYFYRITPFETMFNLIKSMGNSTESTGDYYVRKCEEHGYKSLLDYGAGSGYLSMYLHQKGLKVSVTEINLCSLEWMRYIFNKKGYDIKVIDVLKQEPILFYDCIIVKDVFEHIEDPQKLYDFLIKRCKCLFYGPMDIDGPHDIEPMHFKFDKIKSMPDVHSETDNPWK